MLVLVAPGTENAASRPAYPMVCPTGSSATRLPMLVVTSLAPGSFCDSATTRLNVPPVQGVAANAALLTQLRRIGSLSASLVFSGPREVPPAVPLLQKLQTPSFSFIVSEVPELSSRR